ncbi:Helitron helicase [Phytophthora megakarya]|uniref:Helitron helicase n=1 Tax=Phytophthora megakarya TaxID=4795 RepID=A0A225V139_9STRA|nr:Helitron helicase [Phytophthora megakarya]
MWNNATINKWIVPYNPYLSQKYNCHINVEVCATNKAVKYIYKYVYKGSDMTTITIEGEEIQANEILQYLTGRYISPVEACMRLFSFPTQGSSYSVVNLPIHLESMNPEGTENLLYKDVPKKYRWDDRSKRWAPYKTYLASLGRLVHVSPQDPERFYRVIVIVDRPTGYLEDDREWEECLAEAVSFKMPYTLRQFFGTILVYSLPDHASALWDRFKKDFSEDYYKSIAERDRQNNIERDEEVRLRMAEYKCLKWVAEYLLSNGKMLDMYDLPELSTYRDVSEEVEREDIDPRDVVANEIATYEPEDLA